MNPHSQVDDHLMLLGQSVYGDGTGSGEICIGIDFKGGGQGVDPSTIGDYLRIYIIDGDGLGSDGYIDGNGGYHFAGEMVPLGSVDIDDQVLWSVEQELSE